MSNLLEIYLPVNPTPGLYDLLKIKYAREKLLELWFDPFDKPVAVAMFEKKIETSSLEKECSLDKWKVIQKFSKPTWSLIVKLHKDLSYHDFDKTVLHKLPRPGKVHRKIPPVYFEILFENGWDDVMAVFHQRWNRSEIIKSVHPFFDCFKKKTLDVRHAEFDKKENSAVSTPSKSTGAIPEQTYPILQYPLTSTKKSDLTSSMSQVTQPLLSILLDALNFPDKSTVLDKNVKVCICLSTFTIHLEGPKDSVERIKYALCLESDKLKCSDEMKSFLNEVQVQEQIKHMVKEQHLQSFLDLKTPEVYLIDIDGHKRQLKDLQSSLLVEKCCATLPVYYDRSIFEAVKSEIETSHVYSRLSVNSYRDVVLCSVTKNTGDDSLVQIIKDFISSHFEANEFTFKDPDTNAVGHYSSSRNSFENSKPENAGSKCKVNIIFPGLNSFLNSEEGNDILVKLLSKHKIPVDSNRSDHTGRTEITPDFRVLFLGKAYIGPYQLHLVQGSVQDVKITKKIIFSPTHEDIQCYVKGGQSAPEVRITLPPWRHFSETDFKEDLLRLRKSLYNVVEEIFQTIEANSDKDVAFCTSEIHSAEFPFPLDLLAKCVLEVMEQRKQRQYKSGTCNVYIFESYSVAVFKAFNFFLGRKHMDLDEPDDDTWIRISYPDNHSYSPVRANVEIRSNNPIKKRNTLYCYPVDPTLNAYSSPVIKEVFCLKHKLVNSIKWFKRENQSLTGQCCKVNCFINGAPAALYAVPQWGPDGAQVIQDSLRLCLTESASYKIVHIVPPGLHVVPKYPKKYLAQTVCKVLHQLILERKSLTEKHIVLVVDNTEYRKAFQIELEKYFESVRRQPCLPLINFHTKDESSNEFVIEGNCQRSLMCFKSDLCDRLNQLMAKNYMETKLNRDQTLQYQAMFSNAQNLKVLLKIQEFYEHEKFDAHKKMGLHSGKSPASSADTDYQNTGFLTGSLLTIRGLKKQWVEEFSIFITEIASNVPSEKPFGASNYDFNSSDEDGY